MPALTIRPEQPADYGQVFQVVQLAFGQPDEARLVEALRGSPAFVPGLSLIANEDGQVVGHVLFSHVVVQEGAAAHPALALAPLAVLPARQRVGIGGALVKHGLAEARRLGHGAVVVVGHPGYYPRFGFNPGEPLGIRPPFPVSPGAFMVLELRAHALADVRGEVQYPPEFRLASGTAPPSVP
jgi:putative acetyltransferase